MNYLIYCDGLNFGNKQKNILKYHYDKYIYICVCVSISYDIQQFRLENYDY